MASVASSSARAACIGRAPSQRPDSTSVDRQLSLQATSEEREREKKREQYGRPHTYSTKRVQSRAQTQTRAQNARVGQRTNDNERQKTEFNLSSLGLAVSRAAHTLSCYGEHDTCFAVSASSFLSLVGSVGAVHVQIRISQTNANAARVGSGDTFERTQTRARAPQIATRGPVACLCLETTTKIYVSLLTLPTPLKTRKKRFSVFSERARAHETRI